MADELRYRCVATLRGHTNNARACVLSNKASEQQSGAQDLCVAALPDGRVVSGSGDRTLMVWDVSTGACLQTLRGHRRTVRGRRPVKPHVDRSSTPRGAQVECVTALPNDRVVSGSLDNSLRVWDASTSECIQTLRQTEYARRLRPA